MLLNEPCFLVSHESDGERDGGREASLARQRLLCPLAYTSFKVQKGHLLSALEMQTREACMGQVSIRRVS